MKVKFKRRDNRIKKDRVEQFIVGMALIENLMEFDKRSKRPEDNYLGIPQQHLRNVYAGFPLDRRPHFVLNRHTYVLTYIEGFSKLALIRYSFDLFFKKPVKNLMHIKEEELGEDMFCCVPSTKARSLTSVLTWFDHPIFPRVIKL